MRISVFGLGYVGAVSAACLAESGHEVIGVDSNPSKVDFINEGVSPIIEKDLDVLVKANVGSGRLRATVDERKAISDSDLSLVCVGTPSQHDGSLDLQYLERVCEQIGASLSGRTDFHVVVIRSTIVPGTMRRVLIPVLESNSGKRVYEGFGVCHNPEFLREGTAVHDFHAPPKTVIGADDAKSADIVASLYVGTGAPLIRSSLEVAEMVKYADNAWHALKVAFGNEIGNICKAIGIDSHQVMDIFCQDTKLNISPSYLKPGFAFGGPCLPKDLRALCHKARSMDLEVPVLDSILTSNRRQIERSLELIASKGSRKVGFLGLSYKAGTDDLRESPIIEIIERLIGKDYDLRLYDRNVKLARLMGTNLDYITKVIPHIASLMTEEMDEVVDHGDVIVIGNADPAFHGVVHRLQPHQTLVDMVRVPDIHAVEGRYDGINW